MDEQQIIKYTASNGDFIEIGMLCTETEPCYHSPGGDGDEIAKWFINHDMEIPQHFQIYIYDSSCEEDLT